MTSSERNYGADILKLLSMFMVVTIHILLRGGVLKSISAASFQYDIATFIEWLVQPCVDIFVLTTGYLYAAKKQYSFAGILKLWVVVWFYSVAGTVLVGCLHRSFSGRQLIDAVFPVLREQYWFFTQYFALYLFIPFLNRVLDSRKVARSVIVLGLGIFSFAPVLSITLDPFKGNFGNSFVFFVLLYLCGGYYRRYREDFTYKKWGVAVFLCCILCGWVSGKLIRAFHIPILPEKWLLFYSSPLVILAAMALLVYFTSLKVHPKVGGVVKYLSSLSFGVYLIHEQPLVRETYMRNAFVRLGELSPALFAGKIFLFAIGIFFACLLIEAMRKLLFKVLFIDKLIAHAIKKISKYEGKISYE